MADVDLFQQFEARLCARRPVIHEAELLEMRVVEGMQAAVRGLLPDEALHFGAEGLLLFRRQRLGAVADRVDEELLADGKAHGKSVEERGAEGIVAAPVARDGRFHVDEQAANDEIGHKGEWYSCVPAASRKDSTQEDTMLSWLKRKRSIANTAAACWREWRTRYPARATQRQPSPTSWEQRACRAAPSTNTSIR